MKYIFWLKVAALHGLAAWSGLAAYLYFNADLSVFWFRIGNLILAVFFTLLVTLVYAKFFHHLSIPWFGLVMILVFILADIVFYQMSVSFGFNFTQVGHGLIPSFAWAEHLIVYAAVAVTTGLTYSLYNAKRS